MTHHAVPTPPVCTDVVDDLTLLIGSRHPIVVMRTDEESRALRVLGEAAARLSLPALGWTVTRGLTRLGEDQGQQNTDKPLEALRQIAASTGQPLIAVFKDLGSHLSDPVVERAVRDICRQGQHTLIILDSTVDLPASLRSEAATFDLPRPSATGIAAHVRETVEQLGARGQLTNTLSDDEMHSFVESLRGLTFRQIDRILARIAIEDGSLDADDLRTAVSMKGEMLADDGVLELVVPDMGMDWVSGMPGFRTWVQTRRAAFHPDAAGLGLAPPKGVLLTGVPGCGKSFAIKALAHDWNQPLLRLDMGTLFNSFVGESEANLRRALASAEALAPSILWLDEIEKAFGGSTGGSGGSADGGLTRRMLGTIATWMQERTATVFVAATSNDAAALPAELTRQGRFDEVFFVDLPEVEDRAHLFQLQLAKRGRDHLQHNTTLLARASEGFSGAEIEQAIVNAMYSAFAAGDDLSDAHVHQELARTRPLSVLQHDQVAGIRDWGARHARAA